MKCIILAAGYATRLYPLTENTAKPLLEVGNKTILDHIIKKIEKIDDIDDIYIVTNEKFYSSFVRWRFKNYKGSKHVVVMNDKTTSNDNRLGAIKDIQYVIDEAGIHDDLMVLAGDNLFEFELTEFVDYYQHVKADCITTHELTELDELQGSGVIEVDHEMKVTAFEEKPEEPKSNLAVPPFYIYQKDTIPLLEQYLEEGNNPDAPGNFIPWLIQLKEMYAFKFEGLRYDIGTPESYEKVQKLFE